MEDLLIDKNNLSLITQQHDRATCLNTSTTFPIILAYLNKTLLSNGVRFVTVAECMGLGIPPYRPNPRLQNDPTCQNGIRTNSGNSVVCCPSSCGVCGGTGCGLRLGGASNCCPLSILNSGFSCQLTTAPCIVATQPPTQLPTEIPTEVPTQPPTQVPTQRPTKVPTQPPTEGSYSTSH